jgi:hypothetical protein
MSDTTARPTLVTAAYTIPEDVKARIEREAAAQDLNASQVMRRILNEHYRRVDAELNEFAQIPQPKPNRKSHPAAAATVTA